MTERTVITLSPWQIAELRQYAAADGNKAPRSHRLLRHKLVVRSRGVYTISELGRETLAANGYRHA